MEKCIRVLIVEDSLVARELLVRILQSDPQIEVIGAAPGGREALAMLGERRPDVVTMDIHMPEMDGFEVTRQIMETHPLPIVIVSALVDVGDVEQSFRAMQAGAVAIVEKPVGLHDRNHTAMARKLIDLVKAMSEVRVIRRWARGRTETRPPDRSAAPALTDPKSEIQSARTPLRVVVIGASTGGPPVLQNILSALRKPFSAPILIVQHISAGFVHGLVDWLSKTTSVPVHLAAHGMHAQRGHGYVAPDGLQMRIERGERITCKADPPENNLRPAIAALFRSAAEAYGPAASGVLLTGMGRDGADELHLMRQRGAITFAQDEESSIVFGMPGEAVKIGAATYVLPPDRIAHGLGILAAEHPANPPST